MTSRGRRILQSLLIALAVTGLPLFGAALAGQDLRRLFVFPPPLEIPTDYARFVGLAAAAILLLLLGLTAAWWSGRRRRPPVPVDGTVHQARLPWWGWGALGWTLAWWLLAWTRFAALAHLQPFTFFPLWLGFIVLMNGCTTSRRGDCLMTRAPARWLGLFALSAGFWWIFEWLNRFVRNWHYLGVQEFGPATYALHATLCFSTVLPALAAVAEALGTVPAWVAFSRRGPRCRWLTQRRVAWTLVAGGSAGLLLTGVWPRLFYPALWAGPLALLLGLQAWTPRAGPLVADCARGDWRLALTWMAAALVCGGFWEMWNWLSLAKWIYTVPGVERWFVFEMPLLGYTGYLPFGLEGLLILQLGAPGTLRALERAR